MWWPMAIAFPERTLAHRSRTYRYLAALVREARIRQARVTVGGQSSHQHRQLRHTNFRDKKGESKRDQRQQHRGD